MACDQDPACNQDPASISTNYTDPRPVSGSQHLYGTRPLPEVLQYGRICTMYADLDFTWIVKAETKEKINKLITASYLEKGSECSLSDRLYHLTMYLQY